MLKRSWNYGRAHHAFVLLACSLFWPSVAGQTPHDGDFFFLNEVWLPCLAGELDPKGSELYFHALGHRSEGVIEGVKDYEDFGRVLLENEVKDFFPDVAGHSNYCLKIPNLALEIRTRGIPYWVRVSDANIRESPSSASAAVTRLSAGHALFSNGETDDVWLKVSWKTSAADYSSGWVHKSLIWRKCWVGRDVNNTCDRNSPSWSAPPSGKWSVGCKEDTMEDLLICTLSTHGSLSLILTKTSVLFSVGASEFPGSEIAIRVDKNSPIRWKEDTSPQQVFARLIRQLKTGQSVMTRYTRWPAGTYDDATFNNDGASFAAVYEYAKHQIAAYGSN